MKKTKKRKNLKSKKLEKKVNDKQYKKRKMSAFVDKLSLLEDAIDQMPKDMDNYTTAEYLIKSEFEAGIMPLARYNQLMEDLVQLRRQKPDLKIAKKLEEVV